MSDKIIRLKKVKFGKSSMWVKTVNGKVVSIPRTFLRRIESGG